MFDYPVILTPDGGTVFIVLYVRLLWNVLSFAYTVRC